VVSISERPPQVGDRAVPGHWEGDLLLGKHPTAVGTLVERTSRYVMLFSLPRGYGADQVRRALARTIVTLPDHLRRSLTWDQGPEMAEHVRFTVDTGVAAYFCNPHSPWQRGSNENTNRLRQYLPKGGDFRQVIKTGLNAIAAELNSRPWQRGRPQWCSQRLHEPMAALGALPRSADQIEATQKAIRLLADRRAPERSAGGVQPREPVWVVQPPACGTRPPRTRFAAVAVAPAVHGPRCATDRRQSRAAR
jgi:hypothetical protein